MSNGTPSESKEEMKQEFKKEDANTGGDPETDREKNRRKNFIELYDNEPSSGSAESTQPTTGTCRQVGPDTVTKIAVTRVCEWMSGAKLHAEALKLQNLVSGMADFGARFNTLLTPGFVQQRRTEELCAIDRCIIE